MSDVTCHGSWPLQAPPEWSSTVQERWDSHPGTIFLETKFGRLNWLNWLNQDFSTAPSQRCGYPPAPDVTETNPIILWFETKMTRKIWSQGGPLWHHYDITMTSLQCKPKRRESHTKKSCTWSLSLQLCSFAGACRTRSLKALDVRRVMALSCAYLESEGRWVFGGLTWLDMACQPEHESEIATEISLREWLQHLRQVLTLHDEFSHLPIFQLICWPPPSASGFWANVLRWNVQPKKNNPSAMPCQSAESPMPCPNPACRPCPPGPSPIADRGNLLEDNMRSKNETRLRLISSINLVTDKPKASAKHWCFLLSLCCPLRPPQISVSKSETSVSVAWALIRM